MNYYIFLFVLAISLPTARIFFRKRREAVQTLLLYKTVFQDPLGCSTALEYFDDSRRLCDSYGIKFQEIGYRNLYHFRDDALASLYKFIVHARGMHEEVLQSLEFCNKQAPNPDSKKDKDYILDSLDTSTELIHRLEKDAGELRARLISRFALPAPSPAGN